MSLLRCAVTYRPVVVAAAITLLAATPAAAGGLSFVEAEFSINPPPGNGLRGPAAVAVSPDGDHVYVVSDKDDALAVWDRDSGTGAVTFSEVHEDGQGGVDGLRTASSLALTPDGECVYVTGERDDAVAVFDRDAGTGLLTFVESHEDGVGGVDGLATPVDVVTSPDDAHVYVASLQDDAIAVFSRSAPDCDLTFVEAEVSGGAFRRPRTLAIEPGGDQVYVGARFDTGGSGDPGSVAVLSRDAGTGELTFVSVQVDGTLGVEKMADPRDVAVSADGADVYVAAADDSTIVHFERDGGTGALSFVTFIKDGGGVDGLKSVRSIAVSADGAYVYAAGRGDDEVSVFRRSATTGTVTFLEVQADPLSLSGDVLVGATAVALSPGDDSLYTVAAGSNTMVVFAVDSCGNGAVGIDEQCDDGGILGGDGCSPTCKLELCGPAPSVGCRVGEPLKGSVQIKDKEKDKSDQIKWKWNKGAVTTLAEYGDPTSTASYALCVYDATGLLLNLVAPAGGTCAGKDCWQAKPTSFKYKDKLLTPDGLKQVQLKEGLVPGKAKIQVQGKGVNVFVPTLPLTLPVTVQLKNTDNALCWESVFSTFIKNEAKQFKAKSD